jgi:hypothetical protein
MTTAISLLLLKKEGSLRSDKTLVGFIHKQGYEEKLIERLIQAMDVLNNPKKTQKTVCIRTLL